MFHLEEHSFNLSIPLRLESGKNIFTLFSQEILQLCPAISGSECTILLIKPDETLYFVGKIRLALLHGSVSLMGTAIKSSSTFLHVFAPKTHSLPSLVGNVPDTSTGESMAAFPGRILEHLELTHSVVAMTKDTSGLDFLSRLSPTFEGLFDVDWENGETFLPGFYPVSMPVGTKNTRSNPLNSSNRRRKIPSPLNCRRVGPRRCKLLMTWILLPPRIKMI